MPHAMNIYSYNNYRTLIADFFSKKNAKMKGNYSYRALAKAANFASPNYVQWVVQGKRNLSATSIHNLALAMNFTAREQEFFENLVLFNQADSPIKKTTYLERLIRFREFVHHHPITQAQYTYFSKWYHIAIRELISLPEFKADPHWIASHLRPTISPREAKETLRLLQSLNLIERDSSKRYRIKNAHLRTEPDVTSSCIVNYHREMLEKSLDALAYSKDERDFAALTFSADQTTYHAVQKKIWQFLEEIQDFIAKNSGKTTQVSQINLQCFPLSQKIIDAKRDISSLKTERKKTRTK